MFLFTPIKKIYNRFDIFFILLLAGVLRVVKIQDVFYGSLNEFLRDLNILHEMLTSGQLLLMGPGGSAGFNFGVIYYYLLTPFYYLFKFSPVGLIFTSTVFSILAIFILFKLLQEWFPNRSFAEQAKEVLAQNNIACVLKSIDVGVLGTASSAMPQGVNLYVDPENEERAVRLIDAIYNGI